MMPAPGINNPGRIDHANIAIEVRSLIGHAATSDATCQLADQEWCFTLAVIIAAMVVVVIMVPVVDA
jgi:hypothetical protein